MDANIPSTLPMTVDVGVEEIVEPHVDNVGTHTIRGKSSVVGPDTVVRSDMGPLNDGDCARTRSRLSGARQSHWRTERLSPTFAVLLLWSRRHGNMR